LIRVREVDVVFTTGVAAIFDIRSGLGVAAGAGAAFVFSAKLIFPPVEDCASVEGAGLL